MERSPWAFYFSHTLPVLGLLISLTHFLPPVPEPAEGVLYLSSPTNKKTHGAQSMGF
jgi:hypothetical protein